MARQVGNGLSTRPAAPDPEGFGQWELNERGVVTDMPLLDALLAPHRAGLGPAYLGYRSHCYRMLNWARFVTEPEPFREETLAVMTVFHDLPFMFTGDLDYLDAARALAEDYLVGIERTGWSEEIALMIENHHKVRSYSGPHAPLVEACRKADWIDVSFTKLRFGIPRRLVVEVRSTFPMNEAYKGIALPAIARYAASHLSRPLPMMRW